MDLELTDQHINRVRHRSVILSNRLGSEVKALWMHGFGAVGP